MEIGFIMTIFFLVVVIAFFIVAFFLPEWVGITGNKAKDVLKHQAENPDEKPSDQARGL